VSVESQLPQGWEVVRLVDLAAIEMGQSPPSSTYNSMGTGLPFFQGKAEFRDRYAEARVWCSEPNKIAEQEDILLSVRAPVGPTNLAPSRCCIGRGLSAIRPEAGINRNYLLHAFRRFANELDAKGTGTTFKAVSGQTVRNFLLPIAPSAEQSRIADALDELLSDLDAGVAVLERARGKLKQYRASVLKAAVEGALTADWRKAHPDAEPATELLKRILAERRRRWEEDQLKKFKDAGKAPPKDWKEKYREPAAPDTTNLPPLPSGWCWASCEQVGDTTTGFTPPTNRPELFGGPVPFFKPTDLDAGYHVVHHRESLTLEGSKAGRLVPALSILVTCIGATIGKTGLARVECATNQQINSLTIPHVWVLPQFAFWFMNSPIGQMQIVGNASATTLPILNKSRFEALPIALPPISEQRVAIETVEKQISVIDHLEAELDAKLTGATALRQSILRHAFTGKLVPQDPNDEPASELLKRISAEREQRQRAAKAEKRAGRKPGAKPAGKRVRAEAVED